MPATQILQMQHKMPSHQGPAGHSTESSAVAQHAPSHQQYQYQQRTVNGDVSLPHQHPQQQYQPQYNQQQKQLASLNPSNISCAPQFHTQPVTVMANNSNHSAVVQQQQHLQQHQTKTLNTNQRSQQLAQHQLSQRSQQVTYNQGSNMNRSNNTRNTSTTVSQSSIISHGSSKVEDISVSDNTNNSSHTPLYERLVSEEMKELKEYARLIEQQSRRLQDLEKINHDLENRLEMEVMERQRLECTLQQREKYWKTQTCKLEGEIKTSERMVKEEKMMVEKLLDMVNRLQNEIQSMIKNKFSHSSGRGGLGESNLSGSVGAYNSVSRGSSGQATPSNAINLDRVKPGSSSCGGGTSANNSPEYHNTGNIVGRNNPSNYQKMGRHMGPHELLAYKGSAEAVRERNAFTSLLDFFGM